MKAKLILNNKEYEVEVSEELVNKIEKPKYKRWRAEKNEKYYFLSDLGEILSVIDFRDKMDNFRYDSGNYGETKKALEEYKKKLLYQQQYKDFIGEDLVTKENWKNKYLNKFYAYYNYYDNIIDFYYDCQIKRCGGIYSKSKQKILDFIKEIGEDNFKKYILEVEE